MEISNYNKRQSLSNALINSAEANLSIDSYFIYDTKIAGLYIRVAKTAKTFYLYYSNHLNEQRRIKLGRFPKLGVKDAREISADIIANTFKGIDFYEEKIKSLAMSKQKKEKSKKVEEIFQRYYEEYCSVHTKTHKETLRIYNRDIHKFIGKKRIKDISLSDLNQMHIAKKDSPRQANRLRTIMSHFLNWCEQYEYRDMNTNPTKFVKKYKERSRNRYLNEDELIRLGKSIARLEKEERFEQESLSIIKMLMFTGCRVSEIKDLKWSEVDLETGFLRLADSKTGEKTVPLGRKAIEILRNAPKHRYKVGKKRTAQMEYVFGNPQTGKPRWDIKRPWETLLEYAEITEETHLHDLRHTFASIGAKNNLSTQSISKILGHNSIATTEIYTHIQDRNAQATADAISNTIAGYIG